MSQNYIITNGELCHYGVKGMKWGQRRYRNEDGSLTPAGQKRYNKAENRIRKFEVTRKNNRNLYEEWDRDAEDKYSGSKEEKLKKVKAQNKALYDSTEITNKYLIAKQKAKQDPDYTKSDEYLSAVGQYGKQQSQRMWYGERGHIRIESLKNRGFSEKKAKAKVTTEVVLANIGVFAVSSLLAYAARNQ